MKKPHKKKSASPDWREIQAQSLPPRVSSPPTAFRLRVTLDSRTPRQVLDTHCPVGEYRIDAIADEMLSAGLLPKIQAKLERAAAANPDDPDYDFLDYWHASPATHVREEVKKAASSTIDNAYWELVDRPALNVETREHLQDIFDAQRLLTRISKRNSTTISLQLAQFKGVAQDAPLAAAYLDGIQSAARQFDEWANKLLFDFPYKNTPNTNRHILSWHFINEMASSYERLTGRKPSVSKSGPFVRLLVAAWQDLAFPSPTDRDGCPRDDLHGWLGSLIEKHPAVYRKSSEK